MAIQPGTYNFTLQRRSDHSIPLLFKDGNDAAINLTNYTGTYKMQAAMSLQPLDSDYFDITGQSYTVTAKTGVDYHTFIGMYTYVRLVHTPAVGNAGTLDKVTYRS